MKLVIVEDSRILRERLRAMVGATPGAVVVAEADGETEALARIDQHVPDVVLLDLRLRSGSGLSVLESVKARYPDVIVMVLTNYGHAEYRNRCRELGADFFFDKSGELDAFCRALAELGSRLFPHVAPAVAAAGASNQRSRG